MGTPPAVGVGQPEEGELRPAAVPFRLAMSPSAFTAMPRLCLVLVLAVATVACGGRRIGAGPDADVPTMPSPCAIDFVDGRTIGIAPVASLGPGVRPQLAAFHGEILFMTVFTPCTPADEIVLWELNTRSHAATATPLGITPAGLWQALAVADDGTVWVGTRDALVHVHTDRSLERLAVPPARAPVPTDFVSRAGAGNAAGAITALAAVGDTLLLGRAGHREITTLNMTTQGFAHLTLPRPFGEVKAFLTLGSADVAFSATRASGDPLGSHDAVGVLDVGTERIALLPLHGERVPASRQLAAAYDRARPLSSP